MLCKDICKKNNKFEETYMISLLTYFEAVWLNKTSRFKGILLKWYLLMHGCKVGKGLKCAKFPYFKGFPNKNITIGNYVDLGRNNTFELSKNGKIILDDYVLLHQNILISCNNQIKIGKFSAVAENVSIRDGNHQFSKNQYYRLQDSVSEPIEIGEDAGIAAGCVVLMGAKISKGAFIGSNSVITRKSIIEEYGIYAGNPLKLIATRK
jgi:acetyltransferase-like isoleucine patch superfamily enzyme